MSYEVPNRCHACGRKRDPSLPTPLEFLRTAISDGKPHAMMDVMKAAEEAGMWEGDIADAAITAHRRGFMTIGPGWEYQIAGAWKNG